MAYYYTLYNKVSWTDWFSVIGHGLPLDLSLAGYLTILPGLLLIASAWTDSRILQLIRRIYFTIISILLSCIFISDLGLYGYWGFRLDTTPLFYFFSSPKDALASVSLWVVAGGILAMAVYAVLLYFVFSWILVNEKTSVKDTLSPFERIRSTPVGYRSAFYPDTRRIQRINHEFRQSFFQCRPTVEPCRHQSGFQPVGFLFQTGGFR